MASFNISIQKHQKRIDGKYPVSIRLTFKRKVSYLKTEYYVSDKQLNKELKLTDKFLLKQLNNQIDEYDEIILKKLGDKINQYNIHELKEYLIKNSKSGSNSVIDFVEFALKHIEKIKGKQDQRARRLQTTVNSLIDFFGREIISVREIYNCIFLIAG